MHERVHHGLVEVHGIHLVQERLLCVAAGMAQRVHRLVARQLRRLLEALNVCLWQDVLHRIDALW